MAKTHFEPSIKSRPVYGELGVAKGSQHIFVADAEGAEAILDLARIVPAGTFERGHVIYLPKHTGETHVKALRALGAPRFYVGPSWSAAEHRVRRVLADAPITTRFYLAGTEGLIGLAMREIQEAGYPWSSIQTEHRGSKCRRVQCVHCKGTTEDVTTDPFECAHCGLNLFVRDHYSRRLAAFQGVRVDAEAPGQVPPCVEIA